MKNVEFRVYKNMKLWKLYSLVLFLILSLLIFFSNYTVWNIVSITVGLGLVLFSLIAVLAFIQGYGYNQFWLRYYRYTNDSGIFLSKKNTSIARRMNSLLIGIASFLAGSVLVYYVLHQ